MDNMHSLWMSDKVAMGVRRVVEQREVPLNLVRLVGLDVDALHYVQLLVVVRYTFCLLQQ